MVGLTALATGCGGSVTPKISGAAATPASASAPASPSLKAASTPKAATTISIAPQLYGPGNPCAGVATTVPAAKVSNACFLAWFPYVNNVPSDIPVNVPGQDVFDNAKMPKTALVAQGVDPGTAKQYADAFFRFEVLSLFVERDQEPNALTALDGPGWVAHDTLLQYMNKGYRVYDAEDCMLPTQVSVVTLDADAINYMESQGYQPHSKTAIIATFPTCKGVYLTTTGQIAGWYLGLTAPASAVLTGTVGTPSAVLGNDFYVDGEAVCGPPQMAGVCGS